MGRSAYQCAEGLITIEVLALIFAARDCDWTVIVAKTDVVALESLFFLLGQVGALLPSNAWWWNSSYGC